MPDCHLVYLI